MENGIEERKIEGLESFNEGNSNDISFDLYKNFTNSEEDFRRYWEAFSDFYYITCVPFDKNIEEWKNVPEIYEILKRYEHTADGHPLEILIGKYSEESMVRARIVTEENRKEFEWMWLTVWDPKEYMHLVGFFGWSSWRNNQWVIEMIKKMFPDKIKRIKMGE